MRRTPTGGWQNVMSSGAREAFDQAAGRPPVRKPCPIKGLYRTCRGMRLLRSALLLTRRTGERAIYSAVSANPQLEAGPKRPGIS